MAGNAIVHVIGTGTIGCDSDIRQDYGGFQLGQDLARLNLGGSGADVHLG